MHVYILPSTHIMHYAYASAISKMHDFVCIKEEFQAKNNFLSIEREKSSEQNGAKMMKIG